MNCLLLAGFMRLGPPKVFYVVIIAMYQEAFLPQKVRNIGVYISAMRRAAVGDEIILASMEQLTKLHRNPLVHPDVVLTLDEAISTLGMAKSVVSAMLKT